jgi:hypothetical protein
MLETTFSDSGLAHSAMGQGVVYRARLSVVLCQLQTGGIWVYFKVTPKVRFFRRFRTRTQEDESSEGQSIRFEGLSGVGRKKSSKLTLKE